MNRTAHRALRFGAAATLVLSACAPSAVDARSNDDPTISLPQVAASPRENVPSSLDDPRADGLPDPTVDASDLRSGGPPPDGIPAVDRPRFQRSGAVGWLEDREPVLAFGVHGDERAYPVQILVWHEIVNDTVGGVPVAVSYCPLCNTAVAFDRRLGARVLDFGVSGLLYRSDLVMFDRQTRSLWPQLAGRSVAGILTGRELRAFPVQTVSWGDWKRSHPRGWVLSRDTGVDRRYGTNPYPGYDDIHSRPFLYDGPVDGRLTAMTRVVGIDRAGRALAIPTSVLRRHRVITVSVGSVPAVAWSRRGTASALDRAQVSGGRDVGSTGVFDTRLDGRALHFDAHGAGYQDRETRSRWNVLGEATRGPLAGRSLRPIAHVDSFWFAWSAFRPHTQLVTR